MAIMHRLLARPNLRIGGALALKSQSDRTTRGSDSVAPGSPTDEHAPPSSAHTQGILREYPDHGDELHEQAIPGCNRGRIRTIITAVPHTHATAGGGGFP